MLHKNTNFKFVGLAFLAIAIGGLLCGDDASAACDEDDTPCISITFGEIVGGTDLRVPSDNSSTHGIDRAYFYLPVSLNLTRAEDYSIKVYSENGGELRDQFGNAIPTLTGEAGKGTSLQDLGKDGSVWGYRFNLSNVAEDPAKNYLKVPSQGDAEAEIISHRQTTGETGTTSEILTLGFATAVDGNIPAGSYSDRIVVAVTATPLQTNAFGRISKMQEMTSQICAAATTPSKNAALVDATGIHHGDNRYVPEATLTDVRDGKTYLVRKLADGNCWMSQNLSLELSTNKALTSDTTDLNSKTSWTPTVDSQTVMGIGWAQNDGIARSVFYKANQYWTGGSDDEAFSVIGADAYGGMIGYAQRGVYYSWFAATAGSGKSTDTSTTTDGDRIVNGTVQDSVCPKGWMLPVGTNPDDNVGTKAKTDGSSKTFYNLVWVYTGKAGVITVTDVPTLSVDTLYAFPMNFVPAGAYNYNAAALAKAGTSQLYWSSTVASTAILNARSLNYTDGELNPGTRNNSKGHGFSVRCVAR